MGDATIAIEEIAKRLSDMGREDLIRHLESLHCSFKLDFTPEFLSGVSLERLRHIVLAASLHEIG